MLKILAVSLFAVVACSGAANAGADRMPSFSYTDLPPYHPLPSCRVKRWCVYLWHHQQVHHH